MESDDDAIAIGRKRNHRQVLEEPEDHLANILQHSEIPNNPLAPLKKKHKKSTLPPPPLMPMPAQIPLHPPIPTLVWPEHPHIEIPSTCTGISVAPGFGLASTPGFSLASAPGFNLEAPAPAGPAETSGLFMGDWSQEISRNVLDPDLDPGPRLQNSFCYFFPSVLRFTDLS